jgi:phosphoribosylformylglycinamidine synthase
MQVLFGKTPKMERAYARFAPAPKPLDLSGVTIADAVERLLRLPAIASKSFLITIGDRSITGMVVQDQMVGPWQVPVADCAVTLGVYDQLWGEAMAVGERTPLAVIDAAASARMAVGEVITNLAGAAIGYVGEPAKLGDIKLSANWMAAAGEGTEDQKLFEAVRAIGMELCPALGMTIPVGKDSMSMKTRWSEGGETKTVVSPLSLVVSGFAPVSDVRRTLTPCFDDKNAHLLLIDFFNSEDRLSGRAKQRMGGSAVAQCFNLGGWEVPDTPEPAKLKSFFELVQRLNREGKLLAYHDRSDGGVFVTLLEMAFASQCGMQIVSAREDLISDLFNEELGAVVAIRREDLAYLVNAIQDAGLGVRHIADALPTSDISVYAKDRVTMEDRLVYSNRRTALQKMWSETSFHVQSLRDNPSCAAEEFALLDDAARPGLFVDVGWDLGGATSEKQIPYGNDNQKNKDNSNSGAPFLHTARPRVAVLREQGVNGQVEMAAAFDRAGFAAVDVTMSDLLAGRAALGEFAGLAACGGFSYGDVLGAGSGWAKTILYNERLKAMFAQFFARPDTFSLGVCNGCQMMAQLREIVPGAAAWPHFGRNVSTRFEARICMVEVPESPAIFFDGMAGARMPVVVAHGEGHVASVAPEAVVGLRYMDTYGKPTQTYPLNPSGSVEGIAGLTTPDGRALIVMPHPERVFLGVQHTWTRALKDSPWMRMFENARKWVG